MSDEIVFFDLEWAENHIVEIDVIMVIAKTLDVLAKWEKLIKPDYSVISAFKDRKNGITCELLETADTFLNLYSQIYKIFNGKIWIGHNIVKSDIPSLMSDLKKCAKTLLPKPKYTIYTCVWLTVNFGVRTSDMKLDTLCKYFALNKQNHRSVHDCLLNLEVFKRCVGVMGL